MRKKIQLFLKIIISVFILVIIFNKIPTEQIGDSLSKADLNFILVALALYLLVIYLISFQTSYLTRIQRIKISSLQIFKINLITKFYGLFLPGSISSNVVRWYKLSKFGNKTNSAAVVLFSRFLETFVLIYVGIIFFISYLIISEEYTLIPVALIVLTGLIFSYLVLLYRPSLNFVESKIDKIPFPAGIKNFSSRFFESMHRFHKLTLKDNIKILSIIITYHLISATAFFLLAESLALDISYIDIGWIRSVTILLSTIPVSFAGLGIREGSLIYMLGTYGIPANDALAFSFLIFFFYVFASIGGGAAELINFFTVKDDVRYNELQQIREIKEAQLNKAENL